MANLPFGYEQKLYLLDSCQYEENGVIVSLQLLDSPSKYGNYKLILLSTIFHPQGGGQPADVGQISVSNENVNGIFDVNTVLYGHDGQIEHIGNIIEGDAEWFQEGKNVHLKINQEKRILHKRLHSSGHVIDAAIQHLGLSTKLLAGKGYHFPDGPYVEYNGELTEDELNNLTSILQEEINKIIHSSIQSKSHFLTKEEAAIVCQCDTTNYPNVVRIIEIAEHSCPCGGTHIDSTEELHGLTVTRIRKKKKNIKISYEIR